MKFNKLLVEVRDAASPPEWAPYFLNYKLLKRCINGLGKERALREGRSLPQGELRAPQIRVVSGDSDEERAARADSARETPSNHAEAPPAMATSETRSNPLSGSKSDCVSEDAKPPSVLPTVAITSLPSERAFFQLLTAEFGKAATFYEEAERDMLARFGRVEEGVRQLVDEPLDADTSKLVLEATRRLTNDLIMLESFTVVTFSGVSKILKKHDKVTGFETRAKFMAHHVMQQPLVKCVVIKALVKHCEELFRTAVSTCARLCTPHAPKPAHLVTSVRDRLEPPTPLSPSWAPSSPHQHDSSMQHQLPSSSSSSQSFYPDAEWGADARTTTSSSSSSSRSHPMSNPSVWPPPPAMLQGSLSKSTFDGSSFYVNRFGTSSGGGGSIAISSGSSSLDGDTSSLPFTTATPELRTNRSLSDSSGRRPSRSEEDLVVSALLEIKDSCAKVPTPSGVDHRARAARRPQLKCATTLSSAASSSSVSSSSQQPSWAMLPPPARLPGKGQAEGLQAVAGEALSAANAPFHSSSTSSSSSSASSSVFTAPLGASSSAAASHGARVEMTSTPPVVEASRASSRDEGEGGSTLAHRWTAALLANEERNKTTAAAAADAAVVASGEVTCSEESGSSSASEGSSGDGDDSGESEGGEDVALLPVNKKAACTSSCDSPKRKHSLPSSAAHLRVCTGKDSGMAASIHSPKRSRVAASE